MVEYTETSLRDILLAILKCSWLRIWGGSCWRSKICAQRNNPQSSVSSSTLHRAMSITRLEGRIPGGHSYSLCSANVSTGGTNTKLWVKGYSVSRKGETQQFGRSTQLFRNPVSIFQLITCLEMQSITTLSINWCCVETRDLILITWGMAFWLDRFQDLSAHFCWGLQNWLIYLQHFAQQKQNNSQKR